MNPTYTKAEVIQLVTKTLRAFNYGNPAPKVFPGLTDEDAQIIGLISMSLPGPVECKITDLPIYESTPLGIGA